MSRQEIRQNFSLHGCINCTNLFNIIDYFNVILPAIIKLHSIEVKFVMVYTYILKGFGVNKY